MRATSFFNFFILLLFSLFFIASALPEPPNEFGLSARELDLNDDPPNPDSLVDLPVSNDSLTPEAGGSGGGGCAKNWNQCSRWGYCCKPGYQCCGYKVCCPKGWYCYKDRWHQIKCCPRGRRCDGPH